LSAGAGVADLDGDSDEEGDEREDAEHAAGHGNNVRVMDSLRGRLLIASPVLVDPNFHRTVILIAEHTEEGAMGLVLTRPSDSRSSVVASSFFFFLSLFFAFIDFSSCSDTSLASRHRQL